MKGRDRSEVRTFRGRDARSIKRVSVTTSLKSLRSWRCYNQSPVEQLPETPPSHEMISYTARGVAYARKFSDIPFCKEIASLCGADDIPPHVRQLHFELSPYFEARSKAITNILKSHGIKNILELASGYSPRGLVMTEDPTIDYLETDLPDMLDEKQKIVRALAKRPAPNLRFSPLNVLDYGAFASVADTFSDGPIAIAHEGLLVYFSHEEKEIVAKNIHDVLDAHGGKWVTTDILTRDDLRRTMPTERDRDAVRKALEQTGQDYESHAFVDMDDAKRFFRKLGFAFEIQTLLDVAGPLASRMHGLSPERVENQLALCVWELRPA
jgi:O-methyltransferase involved in polyketide biosynthesis